MSIALRLLFSAAATVALASAQMYVPAPIPGFVYLGKPYRPTHPLEINNSGQILFFATASPASSVKMDGIGTPAGSSIVPLASGADTATPINFLQIYIRGQGGINDLGHTIGSNVVQGWSPFLMPVRYLGGGSAHWWFSTAFSLPTWQSGYDINNSGTAVAGTAQFLYTISSSGTASAVCMPNFAVMNNLYITDARINDEGTIMVGMRSDQWQPPGDSADVWYTSPSTVPCFKKVPRPTGATRMLGQDINNAGHIVGSASFGLQSSKAFFFNGTSTVLMPSPSTWIHPIATGINKWGKVVGTAQLAQSPKNQFRAFVWWPNSPPSSTNPRLLDVDAGWIMNEAMDVNDQGQIAGRATPPWDSTHWYDPLVVRLP